MGNTIINPVIKDEVTFVQTAAATSGRITTLQVTLMPGGGTPLHYHRNFSETFVVVTGTLTIRLKSKTITLSAGQKLTVEKGIAHCFSNQSADPVVFTTVILPGSEGFENALKILYGLAADLKTNSKGVPENLLVMAVVSRMSDMHLAGAGVLLLPLLVVLNLVAELSGLRARLLARYCKNK